MIDYQTYCQIRLFHQERGLSFSQIGSELGIDPETAAKYSALTTYPRRRANKRPSKLDPFKPAITRWLERHPYSATQIYQRLTAAVLDRLLHHGHTVVLEGSSYRMKDRVES